MSFKNTTGLFGQALVDHLFSENNELRAKLAALETFNKYQPKLDEILMPVATQNRIAALEKVVDDLIKQTEWCVENDCGNYFCPCCDVLEGEDHKSNCLFTTARAVREGK